MLKWYESEDLDSQVIIGGQVCLVRNLENYLFEDKLSIDKQKELMEIVCYTVREIESDLDMKFTFYNLSKAGRQANQSWAGRLVIPPLMLVEGHECGLLVSEDESVSILINGKEHICIQVSCPGMDIQSAVETAERVDDLLNQHLVYAFSSKYGYLTSDPTLTGTGMSVSYLMHLPFMELQNKIGRYQKELGQYGFTLRGHFEGQEEAPGCIYRVKNRKTLGVSESEVLSSLASISIQLAIQEENISDQYMYEHKTEIEDQIYRAYGILKYARLLEYEETLGCLSALIIGKKKGLWPAGQEPQLFKAMIGVHPAVLHADPDVYRDKKKINKFRADYMRTILPEIKEMTEE